MSTYASTSAGTALLNPYQQGSRWAQLGMGITGIVLAVVLVVGQISVATSAGIQRNLHQNISHLRDGNETMASIVRKSADSPKTGKIVEGQAATLQNTLDTMKVLNGHMAAIGETTSSLTGTVSRMESASGTVSTGIAGMESSTNTIAELLGSLPAATDRTHKELGRINTDSAAINAELGAISAKMTGYGLPHAKNVKAGAGAAARNAGGGQRVGR